MALSIQFHSHLRKITFVLLFPLFSGLVFGQQKEGADDLVEEGVVLQDKGEVDSAISKYNQALKLDKDNLLALAEMAYSLLSIEKYDECISFCKRAIKTHPHNRVLKTVYTSYGNALDGLRKTEKSIDIYNDGIKLFPEYFQLYYNRGISQNKLGQTEEALMSFQRSATLNPNHASSHNAIGHLLFNNNNIASLLAFGRFLALEPGSSRAAGNLDNMKKIMGAHVRKTEEDRTTVVLSPEMLAPAGKKQKNNFSSAELMLSFNTALDNDSVNLNKTEVEKFIKKFSALCGYLKETEKDNYGFYWDYYVPYFTEMNDKGLVEVFSYIAFTSSRNAEVGTWLESHKTEVAAFYKWSDDFKWRIN